MWVFTLIGVAVVFIAAALTFAYFADVEDLDGLEDRIKFGP